jgi:hypothetical protein
MHGYIICGRRGYVSREEFQAYVLQRRLDLMRKPAPAGSHILISAIGRRGGRTFNSCFSGSRWEEVCKKLYAAGAVYINAIHK